MKTKIQKTMTKQIPIPPQLAESLCIPDGVLELHQMAAGPLIMKGEMTAAEVLAMLDDLHALTEHLLECLQDACGPCIKTYITAPDTYEKDHNGNLLVRCADVTLKDMTVSGDLILGNGVADGKIVLDNVTVTGRLIVWGGGTKAVYCNNGTNMPEIVVCRVDDAVKVYYDRESTLAVIDTIDVKITDRAKAFKETEVIFYDVSGLREAQKQLNAIVEDNQIAFTAPAHLYALVGETSVKAEFVNNSKSDSYTVEIRKNSDNALLTDVFELAAGKSISTLELLEAPTFGDVDCTVTVTAYRDGKVIGTLHTELTLHAAYLWPEEVR